MLGSSAALTFPSDIGSVGSLCVGASEGDGGERARLVRKPRIRSSCNCTDSLAGVRSKEGTMKMRHNRRMGEGPDDGEGRDE